MNDSNAKQLENRITELELLLTHMQRAMTDLDEAVLDANRRCDEQGRKLERLQFQFDSFRQQAEDDDPDAL